MKSPPVRHVLTLLLLAPLGSGAAAQEAWETDFSRHTVPLEEIVSGGPPKDGIPALDRPPASEVRAHLAAASPPRSRP